MQTPAGKCLRGFNIKVINNNLFCLLKTIVFVIIPNMSYVEVKNLFFSYNGEDDFCLKNINFTVEKGQFISFVGHNGSGKSTLAKLLNALLTPTEGDVIIDGISTSEKQKLFDIRKKVGVIFQNPDNQIISSIVEDDVAFGPENLGYDREEIAKRIDFALSAVGMQDFKKHSPTKLSGGQKQRIAIAGVLAIRPEILVLDESTAMLDPKGRKEVLKVVEELKKQGMTVIQITHYMEEVTSSDKVFVLSDGEIIFSGKPEEVFKRDDVIKKAGLDYPVAIKIQKALNENGLHIENVLNKEDVAQKLCELK